MLRYCLPLTTMMVKELPEALGTMIDPAEGWIWEPVWKIGSSRAIAEFPDGDSEPQGADVESEIVGAEMLY